MVLLSVSQTDCTLLNKANKRYISFKNDESTNLGYHAC